MVKRASLSGFIALFISFWVLAGSVSAAKDSGTFISVTTGKRMVAGNIQQAKQGAISDALSAAVQNAFPELLTPQVLASNLDYLYSGILSHPSDFIIAYRVLGEVENKAAFLVAVESRVNLEMLQKTLTDAKILDAGKDKPVIMFFISEKTPADDLPRYWWGNDPAASYRSLAEEAIAGKMVEDRFVVAGMGPQRPDPSFYNITFGSMDDIEAARRLGREMKANLILFGNATSSLATNRMAEEKTFDAQIKVEAYDVNTGEKIIHSTVQAVAKSNSDEEGHAQSLVKAADLSAKDLIEKINSYWARNLRKEASFDLSLSGDNFLPRFIALKQRLREMPEFTSMVQKEIGSNSALVQIVYKGTPTRFANALMLKTFDSFGLEITEVADNLVTLRFIEKEQALETHQAPPSAPEEKKEAP